MKKLPIQFLFLLLVIISCEKESIVEKESSMSDKELLERGQLVYFAGYSGLYSGKLLSNDTIEITTLYDADDYDDDVVNSVHDLEIINKTGTAYWFTRLGMYKADITNPSSNSVKKITYDGDDNYGDIPYDFTIDKINDIMYWYGDNPPDLYSFDLGTNKKSLVLNNNHGAYFRYRSRLEYFGGNVYYIDNGEKFQIVKANVATGKIEVLYEESDGLVEPVGLALDKANKKIYIIDRDGLTSKGIIREGNIDGTGSMEKILDIGVYENVYYENYYGFSNPLAYDQKNGYFFWYDEDKKSFGRIRKGESSPKYWYLGRTKKESNNLFPYSFTVPETDN